MKALAVLLVLCGIASAQPITSNSGLTKVKHDGSMTGDGTSASPLAVAAGGGFTNAGTGLTATGATVNVIGATGGGLSVLADSVGLLTSCGTGQGLVWSGTAWACSASALVLNTVTISAGTGLSGGGDLSANRTLSLNINGGVTQTATSGQAWTSMTAAGILSSSVFVNAAGTGLVLTGSSLSVGLNGNASQACGAGNAVTGLSATGIETCTTLATLGAAAGTGTTNTMTKWSNTSGGLANAWPTDDATTWGVSSKFTITEASGNTKTFGTLEAASTATFDAQVVTGQAAIGPTVNGTPALSINTGSVNGYIAGAVITRASADINPANLQFYKTRATDVNVQTTVANADLLGRISFYGTDGTTIQQGARITATVNGAVSTGVVPTDIVFQTSATNSAALATALTLKSDQSGQFAAALGVTGLSTLTGGFSAGANSTVTGTLGVTVPAAQTASIGVQLSNASTGQTASEQLFYPHSNGSFDATAVGRDNYVGYFEAHATRSAGTFLVRNFAGFFDASGGQTNYALFTSAGDVLLNNGGGTFTAVAGINVNSQKITNCLNGTVSSDGACFGQLATAVNAAVSGTSGTIPRFTGTNTLGNGSMLDNGAATVRDAKSASVAIFQVGDDATLATNAQSGWEVQAYSDGNNYIDSKTITNGHTYYRFGSGANSGANNIWIDLSHNGGAFTMNGAATFANALTASSTAHIVGALTEDGNTTLGDATSDTTTINGATSDTSVVGTTFAAADSTPTLLLQDSTAFAAGDGAAIKLVGKYNTGGGYSGVAIKALKSNSIDGDYGFGLGFGTTPNGGVQTERLDIASTGVTTMLGQGLGVGGLYEGTAQDVADRFNSGTIRKNLVNSTDELGNAGDLSQAQTTTGNNNGWGFLNSTTTIAYVASTAVSPPWGTSTITPAAGTFGKITCTGATCTNAGTSDWRTIETSTNTGISTLQSTTSTFSIWLQMVSGTNAGAVISIARFSDNEKTSATCPTVTATGWTRCSVTKTWSATSYADNSEIRLYIEPRSTTGMYIAGAQLEQNSVPTPYEPNDATVRRGSEGYVGVASLLDNVSMTTTTLTGLTDPGPGAWVYTFGVGNTKENPNAGFAHDGTMFGTNAYVTSNFAALGGFRTGQASSTNYGFMSYDNSGHIMSIYADNHAGTSTINLMTSNSAHAATQVAITSAAVTITPATTITGLTTTTGGISSIAANNTFGTTSFTGPAATLNSTATSYALKVLSGTSSGLTPFAGVGGIIVDGTSPWINILGAGGILFGNSTAANDGAVSYGNTAARQLSLQAGGVDMVDVTSTTMTINGATTHKGALQVNNGSTAKWSVDTNGHVHATGTAPTLTSCGTSPAVVGDDYTMRVTTGSSGTTCTITFANAYTTNAPVCSVWTEGSTTIPTCTVSTSAITCTVTVASTKYDWQCEAPN